jgi:hypothetical protein
MKATDVVIGAEYDWRHRVDGKPWRVRVVAIDPLWGEPAVRHETVVADGGPQRWSERRRRFVPCRVGNRMWETLAGFRRGFRPVG